MLIGITGTDGAGKGAIVDYLVNEKEFFHYSGRAWFLEVMEENCVEPTRENMRISANNLRREFGNDGIVKEYMRRATEAGHENYIIESIRASAEAETLQASGGVLIAVDADQALRYERITSRGSSSDHISLEEFIAHEKLEMNDPDPHGMQKAKVMEMADYTILNEGSLQELGEQIEEVFKKIES